MYQNTQIQLITLEETPERTEKALTELQKFKKYNSYNGEKSKNGEKTFIVHRFKKNKIGWKGCIDSHLQIFQYGKDTNKEILWIAEDNIKFNENANINDGMKALNKFMKECPNWGIIFVGGYILRPWDYCQSTVYPRIYETRNNNHGTVSYIIHKRLYQSILESHQKEPINKHYDIYLTERAKCYILNPLIFTHAHDIVSNVNRKSDIWRRFWFHPRMMDLHSLIFFTPQVIRMFIVLCILAGGLWWVLRYSSIR